MMKFFLFLLLLLPFIAAGQTSKEEERREKLELILRYQNLRTLSDGTLRSFLGDADPVIRERTALAFGSIQDTSILSLLVPMLTDPSPSVEFAAAFGKAPVQSGDR